MKTIPLTKGQHAIVDNEWFDYLNRFKWFAQKRPATYYAARNVRMAGKAKIERMHRVISGGVLVDHVNGDGLDNRTANLRSCTWAENTRNRRKIKRTRSKYKGVAYYRRPDFRVYRPWIARIYFDGKVKLLGYFPTEEGAAKAYDVAATKYHGKFASLNFPNSRIRSLPSQS